MTSTLRPNVRCAIYTRKSSEEGLEQSFNSLQAQREACEAFITSQRHEGWHTIPTPYDDGGFSGGTMNRPALKRLLDDIGAGRIDTVVVYKVDRLTRSLTDFARIIDIFDQKRVSFVSVTQQFNTTTSMGRLTLNVLLSFAQFEREVTGERIRDKIAASKRKGMWMGGTVPMGYDLKERKLVVNPKHTTIVQEIFTQYLRLGSVAALKRYLDEHRMRTAARVSGAGRSYGGRPYSRGALYKLLKNQLYVGQIVHRGESYPGQHQAIIEPEIWTQVSALLAGNNRGHRGGGRKTLPSLLTGLLFDGQGNRYTPTHAVKSGKRYRYYTCQAAIQKRRKATLLDRIPAQEIEQAVCARIRSLLVSSEEIFSAWGNSPALTIDPAQLIAAAAEFAKRLNTAQSEEAGKLLPSCLKEVVIRETELEIQLNWNQVLGILLGPERSRSTLESPRNSLSDTPPLLVKCPFRRLRRRGELRLMLAAAGSQTRQANPSLLKAIARAHLWRERIIASEIQTKAQLAAEAGLNASYLGRILRLMNLAPELVECTLQEQALIELPFKQLIRRLPLDWKRQKSELCIGLTRWP
jgi:site-specific DNA recombinase